METAGFLRGGENKAKEKKEEFEIKLATLLGITKSDVSKSKGNTSTATARALTRLKYPSPPNDFFISDIEKTVIDGIIGKLNLLYSLYLNKIFLFQRIRQISASERHIVSWRYT